MAYLGSLFKHRMIFVALSMMVAVFASFQSVKLFVWSLLIIGFLLFLRTARIVIVSCMIVMVFMYGMTEFQQDKLQTVEIPKLVKWTDTYKINGDRLRGFVKAPDGTKYYVTYKFQSADEKLTFTNQATAGRVFEVNDAELNLDFQLPHMYSFSMNTYLKSHGAIGTVEISSWKEHVLDKNLLDRLYGSRFRINKLIEERFPKSLAPEAQALLFGEQDLVDVDATRAYQKLGITHLFAISGLHIALVSLLFFQGFIRLGVRKEYATLILLIILPLYGVLAGGAPSVWRAVSIVLIILIFHYLKIRIPIDDVLAICFIGFILIQPGVVYQVGFQLSFLATAALIYSTPILQRLQTWWAQSLVISFICQLLVYPTLLFHFFEISLSSFLANLLFVPLFSFVILPINFFLLLLVLISPSIADIVFSFYKPGRELLQSIIFMLQDIPYQMWVPGRPAPFWLIILYVSVFMGFYLLVKQHYMRAIVTIITPAFLFHLMPLLDTDLKISFIDVGQGDSILIEYPRHEKIVLIDTGGLLRFDVDEWQRRHTKYEVGRQVVVPYLKGKGIGEIDVLVLSHADADHVEGADEILREIRVGEIHISPNSSEDSTMEDVWKEVKKYKIPVYEKMAGDLIYEDLKYIWPKETMYEGNNDSLVLKLQYNAFSMLLTGDLEEEGEMELVRKESDQIANTTILKAGHHGSKTSTSEQFLEEVNPSLVIFTAGYENRFGHPHPTVIDRLEDRNIPYAVTGERGTIEIKTNGKKIQITAVRK